MRIRSTAKNDSRNIGNEKISILLIHYKIPTAQYMSIESSLLYLGFDVRSVQLGTTESPEAVSRGVFDLALVDLKMPEDDLNVTMKSIRSRKIPIVGLIGHRESIGACCPFVDDYLVLPPNQALLIEMLKRWIV